MDLLDPQVCYRALQTRDPRFDARLFVGVASTGIYCRPICPARTPKLENCRFFKSAAAAQLAGFRPCLRCRPEAAPDIAAWRGTSNTVSRALALIGEGALDGEQAGVENLASRLGLGERHLRRLFHQHLGAPPIAVAQTRRALFAKQLVEDTPMPMAEVALAAGYGSLRRFNEAFQAVFHRPPTALRRKSRREVPEGETIGVGVTLRLGYRPPYDWQAMLTYLAARAIEGVEQVAQGRYRRTLSVDGRCGWIEIAHQPEHNAVSATICPPSLPALPGIVARIRRAFDLCADIEAINRHLLQDPLLAPLVARHPGLRPAGGWDGFELATRAVLGQQVSVAAARHLGRELVSCCGQTLPGPQSPGLFLTFPGPVQVAGADLGGLGMPGARKAALKALAQAVLNEPDIFHPSATLDESIAKLCRIPGIGAWTAHYIALRALRETDAFPASDVGLLRSAARSGEIRPNPAGLLERAEPWRPWRAYAAQHLWTAESKENAHA